jgi:hypothetical protein
MKTAPPAAEDFEMPRRAAARGPDLSDNGHPNSGKTPSVAMLPGHFENHWTPNACSQATERC